MDYSLTILIMNKKQEGINKLFLLKMRHRTIDSKQHRIKDIEEFKQSQTSKQEIIKANI